MFPVLLRARNTFMRNLPIYAPDGNIFFRDALVFAPTWICLCAGLLFIFLRLPLTGRI
jgi:hypothetical protein